MKIYEITWITHSYNNFGLQTITSGHCLNFATKEKADEKYKELLAAQLLLGLQDINLSMKEKELE